MRGSAHIKQALPCLRGNRVCWAAQVRVNRSIAGQDPSPSEELHQQNPTPSSPEHVASLSRWGSTLLTTAVVWSAVPANCAQHRAGLRSRSCMDSKLTLQGAPVGV